MTYYISSAIGFLKGWICQLVWDKMVFMTIVSMEQVSIGITILYLNHRAFRGRPEYTTTNY